MTHMWPAADYAGLDPGIRFAVKVLHARGIETAQSCEGGAGHSYDRPTVDILGRDDGAGGFAALAALTDYGLPVMDVSVIWPIDGHGYPVDRFWRITFRRAMHERADEQPLFVWSYSAGEP